MQQIKFFSTILLVSFLLFSCSGTTNSNVSNNTASSNSSAEVTPAADKGTITCLMDGKQRTFQVQSSFFEISLGLDPSGAKDGLEILNGDAKNEGFQFEFKKSGTTKIKSNATGDMNCIINYYNPQGISYTGDDATVVVTSYDQNHLTGTFSGKLVNVYYGDAAKNYPQYIQITDGKFDVHK